MSETILAGKKWVQITRSGWKSRISRTIEVMFACSHQRIAGASLKGASMRS